MEKKIAIKIWVEYQTATSTGRNDFSNLQQLKEWLDKHPELAEALGYKKK